MLKGPRTWLLHTLLLLAITDRICGQADRDGNVTVALFQTEAVQRLHVTVSSQTVRVCDRCPALRSNNAFDLAAQGNSLVTGGIPRSRELRFEGQAVVATASGHSATAAGHWLIRSQGGELRVSVVIPLERYVAAVLTAETAASEPAQSLRAMAVVARSFAVAVPARHAGGALCDSTHCQALRLTAAPETIRSAVWDTSGETLWYGPQRVPAYFSQHCGGYTEDAASAWQGKPQPWLVSHSDPWCARVPSAWQAALPIAQVQQALAAQGLARGANLQAIAVVSRDRSGRVQQLRLQYAGGMGGTLRAATLRFALNRTLGWNQLRSDRYLLRRAGERFVFQGTGHGHGVGLCQAGAAEMARSGKSYRDILTAYFPRSTVRISSADAGWRSLQANGFTLRSTRSDTGLMTAASRAYAEAALLWGKSMAATLSVSVFGSTDAYRQATGQPGWNLASTHDERISTQPFAILARNGDVQGLLRHEFLHGAVEAAASPVAPLWLREGLVEVLNHENCPANTTATAEAVNNALQHAASEADARRAHRDACSLAAQEVNKRGLVRVRQMLQQGRMQ